MSIQPAEAYIKAAQQIQQMTEDQFYAAHSDLVPYDNGAGIFVLDNNMNVTLSEMAAYGKNYFSSSNETQALLATAKKLASILKEKHKVFAQYYINEILDDDAAALVLASGALSLFDHFSAGIGSTTAKIQSGHQKQYYNMTCPDRLKETHGCDYIPPWVNVPGR